jgi:hypothetical protein
MIVLRKGNDERDSSRAGVRCFALFFAAALCIIVFAGFAAFSGGFWQPDGPAPHFS